MPPLHPTDLVPSFFTNICFLACTWAKIFSENTQIKVRFQSFQKKAIFSTNFLLTASEEQGGINLITFMGTGADHD